MEDQFYNNNEPKLPKKNCFYLINCLSLILSIVCMLTIIGDIIVFAVYDDILTNFLSQRLIYLYNYYFNTIN